MKKILLLALLIPVFGMADAQDLVIAKQGHFSVGGQTIQRPGTYDNSKFVGWATQVETGRKNCLWFMFMVMVALGYVGK